MAPTWIPLCKTMQRYCEPYFTAVERWRGYSDHNLLANRVGAIEIADRIFTEFSQNRNETYEFDLVCDNPDAPLLEETPPSVGKEYKIGGDKAAFEASKKLVPEKLFNRIGLYFQNFLLKQVAGHSDSYLSTANEATRQSIIAAIEKLFVLPEEAGKARFIYCQIGEDGSRGKFRNFASTTMSETTSLFVEYLIESAVAENPRKRKSDANGGGDGGRGRKSGSAKKQKTSEGKDTGKKNKSNKNKKDETEELGEPGSDSSDNEDEEEDDEPADPVENWEENHPSIGTKVASYFPDGKTKRRKLFKGEVIKYAPPSNPKAKDQLYHILWEDGDEEDYEQKDLDKAIERYRDAFGWITDNHPAIGVKVANFFEIDAPSKGKKKQLQRKLFTGVVKKVYPPSKPEANDQLYHIVWEDGDEEDYDEEDLKNGRELYEEQAKNGGGDNSNGAVEVIDLDEEDKEEEEVEEKKQAKENKVKKEKEEPHGDDEYRVEDVVEPMVHVHEVSMEVIEDNSDRIEEMEVDDSAVDEAISQLIEEDIASSSREIHRQLEPEVEPQPEPVVVTHHVNHVDTVEEIPSEPTTEKSVASPVTTPQKAQRGRKKKEVSEGSIEKPPSSSASKPSSEKKTTAPSTGGKGKGGGKKGKKQEEEKEEEDDWTVNHPSVGTIVAAYFPVPVGGKRTKNKKQLFTGKISRFAPETKKGEQDQLYHVVWEDGDEEDYDEKEYQRALALYHQHHSSNGERKKEEEEETGDAHEKEGNGESSIIAIEDA